MPRCARKMNFEYSVNIHSRLVMPSDKSTKYVKFFCLKETLIFFGNSSIFLVSLK